MDRSIVLLLIGLVFGAGAGFTFAAGNGITLDGHDHGTHGGHNGGHDTAGGEHALLHGSLISIPAGADAPSIEIELTPDPVGGWNLHVLTSNFRFSPEHAGGEHMHGEGHAHVYVNNEKIARLYGPWMHIGDLPDGPATVRVTLNANDHRGLAVDRTPLSASATVGAN